MLRVSQTVRPTCALARASPGATGPRGQAAHSVGSGQLCRSEPASGPRLSLPSPGRGVGCAQRRLRPTLSVRPRPQSMTRNPSPGRGAGRPLAQGLTVTAAPTSGPLLTLSCPQCRPRANCDDCDFLTMTHSLLGPGRAPTVSAKG